MRGLGKRGYLDPRTSLVIAGLEAQVTGSISPMQVGDVVAWNHQPGSVFIALGA